MPGTETSAALDDLALIREAAAEAGRIALRFFKQNPEVWLKGGTSPVSEADYAVDRFLRETLMAARPDYGWLSEEMSDPASRIATPRTFVVDPIDGTRAFLDGLPTWCVSVAIVEDGKPFAGVLDCPAKQEVFSASLGGGANKNGDMIRVNAEREPPLIAGPKVMLDAATSRLGRNVNRAPYIPSLAYRIAMVSEGALDATFIKPDSHDWDLAAAELLLTEAGGRLCDPAGRRPVFAAADPRHGALIAGSGTLLAAMIDVAAANAASAA